MDCSPPGSSVHGILQARILECSSPCRKWLSGTSKWRCPGRRLRPVIWRGGGGRGGHGLLSLPLFVALSLQIFIVELIGRRFLLLLGFSVCFTACSVLTGALVLQVRKAGPGVQPSVWALLCMLIITMSQLLGVSPPPAPATHCSFTVDIPEACRWRCLLKKVPGALLPNSGRATGPLGDRVLMVPSQVVSALGVIQLCFLSTGQDILDALRQHRLCHLLRHRACPWAQYVPQADSVVSLPLFCTTSLETSGPSSLERLQGGLG